MPNWCEGTLRVRGNSKNLAKFINEGLGAYKHDFEKCETVAIDKSEWLESSEKDGQIIFKLQSDNVHVHIEDTYRAFIDVHDEIILDLSLDDDVLYFDFQQACGCNPEEWVNLAKKYDLDFAVYGVDYSYLVCDIRVTEHGEKVEDNSIEYDNHNDFVFNCPFPWIGG